MKTVYNAIFEPHLCYSSLFWAQHSNSINVLFVLQKKKQPYGLNIFEIIVLINLLYSENPTS